MRKSHAFFCYMALSLLILSALSVHAFYRQRADQELFVAKSRLVRTLELTDLCLFTEASYTRHLSQADLHTAFQDYPLSLDHFPSGSIVQPPASVRRAYGKVD